MKITLLLGLALLSSACTHTRSLDPATGQNLTFLRAGSQIAQVTLFDGTVVQARDPRLAPDSTSWKHPITGQWMTVPTEEVCRIVYQNHGQGALEGLGIGFLVGATVGFIAGLADGNDDPDAYLALTAEQKAVVGGGLLGVLGGLFGLLPGTLGGGRDVYRTQSPKCR